MIYNDYQSQEGERAYFHLPGLFEFYELYKRFLQIYAERRSFFYDWCEIGSIYGNPQGCLWAGGRVELGDETPERVFALMKQYGISARLTFSNSLLKKEHLSDKYCNRLCDMLAKSDTVKNGIIAHSDMLVDYLRETYPELYLVSSTTKVLTEYEELVHELEREEFDYVVPDFRLNKNEKLINELPDSLKSKVEFLCNECCYFGCRDRATCYQEVSRKNLGLGDSGHRCLAPNGKEGYRFSKAMENSGFIGLEDIQGVYMPRGFSNFKLEGRGLGSAVVLEMLLYYMVKPEYHLVVREMIYLDNALDLF